VEMALGDKLRPLVATRWLDHLRMIEQFRENSEVLGNAINQTRSEAMIHRWEGIRGKCWAYMAYLNVLHVMKEYIKALEVRQKIYSQLDCNFRRKINPHWTWWSPTEH